MKVAVLIMSTPVEPSVRNIKAMKNTFVQYSNEGIFKNTYDFYEYYYDDSLISEEIVIDKDPEIPNYYIIRIGGKETVYRTYEKTYLTYKYIIESKNIPSYDRFIRINISAYLNLNLVDNIIESTLEDDIYCNAINTFVNVNFNYYNHLYPRGDFYIVSHKTVCGILKSGKDLMYADIKDKNRPAVTHVDDTLFGYAFILYMGDLYFEHLHSVYYTFLPMTVMGFTELSKVLNINSLAVRVKTTPPNTYSGYSWDDNDFRLHDPVKIEYVHTVLKDIKYEITKIDDLIVPEDQERPTLAICVINERPSNIKKVLKSFIK